MWAIISWVGDPIYVCNRGWDLFRLCPHPQLIGCILCAPPYADARVMFLYKDLLCNDTCSVIGGGVHSVLGGGGTNGKDPEVEKLKICSQFWTLCPFGPDPIAWQWGGVWKRQPWVFQRWEMPRGCVHSSSYTFCTPFCNSSLSSLLPLCS